MKKGRIKELNTAAGDAQPVRKKPPRVADKKRMFKELLEMISGKGITRRWLRNYFTLVLIVMIVLGGCVFALVRNYYYNSIEQGLLQRSQVTIRYFSSTLDSGVNSGNSDGFYSAAQAFVESFEGRDKMELQILNASGDVIVSSTGFYVDNDSALGDYANAVQSAKRVGIWAGGNGSGEKVLAVTRLISPNGASGGAVRFVVSLEPTDALIAYITIAVIFLIITIMIIMLLSGSYFISSIVVPVKEITRSASKIAKGDFDIRLQSEHDDEIGALVDSINSMAGELAGSEKIKNDFISTVSHELRTPLTAIKGWGETILSCGSEDKQLMEKGMSVILRESDRLSGLVEDLLDFSRLQSKRMIMRYVKLDLCAEVADVVYMFTERCAAESKEISFAETNDAVTIIGDRDRLRQVFVNIIDNAIKYSDVGGRIEVTVGNDGEYSRVSISDSGCGIPERDVGRVARKFFKANTSRGGFGIGLAVADEITALHQGDLSISSTEGAGTTVTVTFPVAARFDIIKAAAANGSQTAVGAAGDKAEENKGAEV